MSDDAAEMPKSALIIGASRGLGQGLAKELLCRGWNVTATVRSVSKGTGLEDYHGHVTMDTVDINNLATVDAFAARTASKVYDVVFINAGIGGPDGKTAADVTPEELTHVFMTNAIAPVRLAYRLQHVIKAETGILAFMSSSLGSVELTDHSTMAIYSASKAALNQLTRGFAAGLPERDFTILNIHPGWVRTDMGGAHADIDVATSVKGIVDVLESKAGAGGQEFLNYKGETLPW